MDAINQIDSYEQAALSAISSAKTAEELESVRVEFLGKKKGRLRHLQKLLGQVSAEDRPLIGKRFNEVKDRVESVLDAQLAERKAATG